MQDYETKQYKNVDYGNCKSWVSRFCIYFALNSKLPNFELMQGQLNRCRKICKGKVKKCELYRTLFDTYHKELERYLA